MSTYHLEELFAPKSIALVGASPREHSLGRIVLTRMREAAFQGQIHLVNPKYREIDGVATAESIQALPTKPDLVVITAPAPAVPGIVAAAGAKGAAGAIIITAGLGHGPGSLAEVSQQAARKHGLRLVGPNCLGVMVPGAQLNASFAARNPQAGDLALVSQSGAIVAGLVEWAASAKRRILRGGLAWRSDRRRFWRSARLLRRRPPHPRDPPVCRVHQGCPQVHVGGARRRAREACRGRQVRTSRAGRKGCGDAHRRACRLRRRI